MAATKPPGYSDEQWAKFDPQRQQQLAGAAAPVQNSNSQGVPDQQWASMSLPDRYKVANTNAAADAAKNYGLTAKDQSDMAGVKGSLYGVKGQQGSDNWFNALKQSYDFSQRTGIDPNTGQRRTAPAGDFESFVKANIPTDKSGGKDPAYQKNLADWTARARQMGGAPPTAQTQQMQGQEISAPSDPRRFMSDMIAPPGGRGQKDPNAPFNYGPQGPQPMFETGGYVGPNRVDPRQGGYQPPGGIQGRDPRMTDPSSGGFAGPQREMPPGGKGSVTGGWDGNYGELTPEQRAAMRNQPQGPVKMTLPGGVNGPGRVDPSQWANPPQGGGLRQQAIAAGDPAAQRNDGAIAAQTQQQNVQAQGTNPYSTNPFDPNNPDAYQNQDWKGLQKGQEYDPNDVYKYDPTTQPGWNSIDQKVNDMLMNGTPLSGVAQQENEAALRAIQQLEGANPVSVSANDPGVKAAMDIFKQSVAPQLDSQYSLMGLGRSQNKADALNRSMVEALAPQLSEQRQYNEMGAQRKQNQSQFLSGLLSDIGQRRRQGKESEIDRLMNRGDTQRDFEKNMADSNERERLRLQDLYLGAVSPSAIPTGSSSSKDK